MLKIEYKNKTVKEYCTMPKKATSKFNKKIGMEVLSAINFLENAVSFLDVVCFIPFHLHQLKGKRANSFAIDSQGNICCNETVFNQAKVKVVEIVLVEEVTNHYE